MRMLSSRSARHCGHKCSSPLKRSLERRRIGVELSNLVEFVIKGDASSPRLREEISLRERRLAELDQQLRQLRGAAAPARLQIDRTWVEAQIHRLTELLARD